MSTLSSSTAQVVHEGKIYNFLTNSHTIWKAKHTDGLNKARHMDFEITFFCLLLKGLRI